MELKSLLQDEVFVDFFNTFLSLPVFGQTPLYMLNQNKWLMWPNVPFAQVKTGAFLKWLETHRMGFFKQTELYHNYILCAEILDFVSSKSKEDLKWTPADQWLVRKCLGSVRGMHRFRSFLKSTAGAEEELLLFCVRASMFLSMKEEENGFQTLNDQALHTAIRQLDKTGLLSKERPLISQKTVLAKMRMKALNRLQSYWLPQFFQCCKSWLGRVPECRPIQEQYSSFSSSSAQPPSTCEQPESNLKAIPAKSYSSRCSKRQLWSSHTPNTQRLTSRSVCLWLPPSGQEDFQCSNVTHPPQEAHTDAVVHHMCAQTPSCQIPCRVRVCSPPSDVQHSLQPALSAEGLSGGPLRAFLKSRDLKDKQTMLDLLQDLDFLLLLLLKAQGEDPVCAQRQSSARWITETYLTEDRPRTVHLCPDISQHLRELLPSSAAIPWIYTAKHEIAKELQGIYDSFLDAEDEALLSELSSVSQESEELLFSGVETDSDTIIHQTEALLLSEGCCSRLEPAPLTHESWASVALQDLRTGGSLMHKNNTTHESEESKATTQTEATALALDVPVSKTTAPEVRTKAPKKDSIIFEKPSTKPRFFEEVMTSPQYVGHFRQFLQENGAHGALLFIQEVEALRNMEPKRQKAKIRSIVEKFFHREDAMEYLQCSADVISSVTQTDPAPPEVIYIVQHLITKRLEATWFKQYQDTFAACTPVSSESSMRGVLMMNKLKTNAWEVFTRHIRSTRNFLIAMEDRQTRAEFEDYLTHNYDHFSKPHQSKARQSPDISLTAEKFKPTLRRINSRPVVQEFLVNDLLFFLECERFKRMADAGDVMASEGTYSESDYVMLHQKAELIINSFLHTNLSAKLLINTSDSQKEAVLQRFSSGKVDRTLFYVPMMDVLPPLVFCWKKFCGLKVMMRLYPSKSRPVSSQPILVMREVKTLRSAEVTEATLRFSTQHGLFLLLPQTRTRNRTGPEWLLPDKMH